MRNENESTLLEYPHVANERMNATLRYLNLVALVCAGLQSRVFPLVCLKIMQMNMNYGISSSMPTAIGWYGVILLHAGFPLSEAAKYAQIALRLQHAQRCTETNAQVAALCYGIIHTVAHGLPDSTKLYEGYICGLQSGDIRHAMLCAHYLGSLPFHFGKNLADVAVTLEMYNRSMIDYNTKGQLGINKVYEQVVAKLTGCMSSPYDRVWLKENNITCSKVPFHREHGITMQTLMAYILDDYCQAWKASAELRNIPRQRNFMLFVASFFHGMTALALLAQTKETKDTQLNKVIASCRKTLKNGCEESSINFGHYRHLLEAEFAALHKKFNAAEQHFSLAIEHASNSGVTHIHALAWERFGYCNLMRDDRDLAYEKLRTSHKLYNKWGKISIFVNCILHVDQDKSYFSNLKGARLKCQLMERKFKGLLL